MKTIDTNLEILKNRIAYSNRHASIHELTPDPPTCQGAVNVLATCPIER